jgi:hypothetical protein
MGRAEEKQQIDGISPCRIPRLLDGPRTGDEDLHESPGALRPVRAGRHVGDADKSPK